MVLAGTISAPCHAQTCILSLSTPGTLDLSGDGLELASDEGSGVGAVMLVTSLLTSHTITIAPPQLVNFPGGYNSSGQVLEVGYQGLAGLSGISQDYTTGQTQFSTGVLGIATALVLNNRVTNPFGFSAGTYQTQTVVTCS